MFKAQKGSKDIGKIVCDINGSTHIKDWQGREQIVE